MVSLTGGLDIWEERDDVFGFGEESGGAWGESEEGGVLTGVIDTDPEADGEGELIGEMGGVGVLEGGKRLS